MPDDAHPQVPKDRIIFAVPALTESPDADMTKHGCLHQRAEKAGIENAKGRRARAHVHDAAGADGLAAARQHNLDALKTTALRGCICRASSRSIGGRTWVLHFDGTA